MDTSRAYEIEPAANGGAVVIEGRGDTPMGCPAKVLAAFTTPADMIKWLAEQYGLQSHPTPKPDVEPEWTNWSGYSMLEPEKGLPCIARLRDGREISAKTFDFVRHWCWAISDPHPSDVMAYRLV